MKKLFVSILASMMVVSMTSCGVVGTVLELKDAFQQGFEEGMNSVEDSTDEAVDAIPDDAGDVDVDVDTDDTNDADDADENKEMSFEPVTVVDNENCYIQITGAEYDDLWGYTMKVALENKSADTTYTFSCDDAAVNGLAAYGSLYSDIAPGKKANDTVSISFDNDEEFDLDEYTNVELSFRVYNSEDWSQDDVADETVNVYPYGEDKAVQYVREADDDDVVLVDNDVLTVTVIDYEEDDIWGYMADLYIINKTDKDIMFTADETSINGYMVDPYYATTVGVGKCKYSTMSWSLDDLAENGIEEVEEIETIFRAYDANDFMADDLMNDVFTWNP